MLSRHRARGASLIEILVAIVIASLGLLTMVAMQAASLRYTHVSQRRAVATLLAGDLSERALANTVLPGDLALYQFSQSFSAQNPQGPVAPAVLCDDAALACTQAQMAQFDLYRWRQRVRDLLPEGAVLTQWIPADKQLGLWIAWRDPVLHEVAGQAVRAPGECPAALDLNGNTDTTVRCLSWRVAR